MINIPLSVDIEAGYAQDTSEIVGNVLTLAKMGCAGVNLEDSIPQQGLRDKEEFALVIKAVKTELLQQGFEDFYFNIRTDTYLTLADPLAETIDRAVLYQQAGADGIFVPCLQQEADIVALLAKITIPLNVMSLPNLTDIDRLAQLGVQRFSYGNAMSDYLIAEMEKLTQEILATHSTAGLYQHTDLTTQFK